MFQFHKSIPSALKRASTWVGLGGVATATAQSLTEPHKTHLTFLGAACACFGVVLKSPSDNNTDKESGNAENEPPQE